MNPAQRILVASITLYRWILSPAKTVLFGPYARCRFTPSCSQYALEAVITRGALAGSWLGLKRICRCHPWGGCGHDPVPHKNPAPAASHPEKRGIREVTARPLRVAPGPSR